MARPYSQDLRDRVVAAVTSGRTCRATAALFGISVASVVKWSQRWRDTGSAAAKPMGGRRPLRLTGEREWLLARIAEKPDLTLRAVMAELAERGTPASYGRCGASSGMRGPCCMDQRLDAVISGPRGLIRCGRSSGVPAPACG